MFGVKSNPSADTYKYPTEPIVYSVSGCHPAGNATVECPTVGNTRLAITGQEFSIVPGNVNVHIGSRSCVAVTVTSSTSLSCLSPVGAGVDQLVVVTVGQRFSEAKALVSYSAPVITGVSGPAVNSGAKTLDCAREGGNTIVISGQDLGPPNAGSTLCRR